MRDFKIITPSNAEDTWSIDIDIIDGEAAYLDEASQTNDQQAALSIFACKGTVPGMTDFGISWGDVYGQKSTALQLNNEMQQQLQTYVGSSSEDNMLTNNTYDAMLLDETGGMGVLIYRGGN